MPETPAPDPAPDPADIYLELRQRALAVAPAEIGDPGQVDERRVFCALMETGYVSGTVTLVSLADGTHSLYFSSGGGIIGLGEHGAVRRAGLAFLAESQASQRLLRPTDQAPLPPTGRVRFYARSPAGLLTAERSEEDLGEQRSSLSPLFNAAHRVITQIRLC